MHPLLRDLLAPGPVLTDGAWGTELQRRGLAPGEFPDAWNLSRPDAVEDVARSYVDAGSRVILTNTFGSNPVRLAAHALVDQAPDLNRRGVEISRRAAGADVRVFASIGPSGRLLVAGETTPGELEAAFAVQARALAEGGADALVIETMSDLDEAIVAVRAARRTGLPVVACMAFDTGRNRDRTMMGVTPEQAAAALIEAGADAIGANCGQGVEGFASLCRRLRASTDRPIWIKANAGLPRHQDGRIVYDATPESFAAHLPALLEAGADFVGGCCGTGPDFIRALHRRFHGDSRHGAD